MVMNSYYALAMTPTNEIIEKYGSKDISMRDVHAIGIEPAVPALDRCLGSANRKLFDAVPCILTKTPILRPTADYGDGTTDPVGSERIHSFESYFSLTDSGIHRPKIVTCVGTSGKRYKQLVKGDDDIRQDAIMQQVFATVNNLLRKNDLSTRRGQGVKTANQDLKIITYACVPITPNSGIIEWVNDTVPFGDCLGDKRIGKQHQLGLHSKYYPGEWGNSLCRTHLKNSPKDQLRQSYDQICKHFSPAFRFFFLERFSHDLRLWYEARKRYVKSCAVNSIAGHILGIGDRHSLNILVHQKTGDIVHIDFGVVFEQGKVW
jgi:ataxia telangiectasia mutated family protein